MGVQNHTAASSRGSQQNRRCSDRASMDFSPSHEDPRPKAKGKPACSRDNPPSQPQKRKQSRRRGNKARRQRSEIGNRREDSWVTRARGAECTSIATRVIRCDMAATPCCARKMVAEESSSGQPASAQIAANHRKRHTRVRGKRLRCSTAPQTAVDTSKKAWRRRHRASTVTEKSRGRRL